MSQHDRKSIKKVQLVEMSYKSTTSENLGKWKYSKRENVLK